MLHAIKFRAMSCDVNVRIDCDHGAAAVLENVPGWVEEFERTLSRFRHESEVSQLNQRVGEWVEVSELLLANIVVARRASLQSGGLFNPLVLGDLVRLGYDRSIECVPRSGPPVEGDAFGAPGCAGINIDLPRSRVRIPAPIDLGGIAKGWTADRLCQRLSRVGPCLFDIGGDIAARGAPGGQAHWPIRVGRVSQANGAPMQIGLCDGSVATSGVARRRWERGGVPLHHIIDPRSGNAATTDVMMATVVHRDAAAAEAWAKVVVVLGSVDGLNWIDEQETGAALVVQAGGGAVWSRRFGSFLIPF